MNKIVTLPQTSLGAAAAAVVDAIAPNPEPIKPGIYFGMAEADYFADASLGASNIKKLATCPCDYWFGSVHNPMRPEEKPTPAQIYGRAVHKYVLEGRDAFERIYAPTDHPGNIKAGIEERKVIAAAGKLPIKRDEWDTIHLAGTMVRANPHLADAFSGGMPEVSVFWESNGIRKKARFDYLKPRATVDLKSIRNSRGIDFAQACQRSVAEHGYYVQCEHYDQGREAARQMIADGAVFGDVDPDWLKKIRASAEWAFVLVFWQAEGAPLTWATMLSPGNSLRDVARARIAAAEQNYRDFSERFGFDTPWVLSSPIEEFDSSELPAWCFR